MGKRRKGSIFARFDARKASRVITFLGILSAIFLTVFIWVIYQPGRHGHAQLVNERTRLRLSFQPSRIQDYISSLAPGITKFISVVPKFTSMQARAFRVDWVHALPYEITFLAEQDGPASVPLTVYVNPIPDNDSFVGEVNAWGALGRMPAIRWQGGRLVSVGEQQYLAKGAIPVADAAVSRLESWPLGQVSQFPEEGGRFVEFAVDNSGGILLALHAAFRNSLFEWASAETDEALEALWPQIARAQVLGDLTRSDLLRFEITVVGSDALDQVAAAGTMEAALNELGYFLSEKAGMTLLGKGGWSNSRTYVAAYEFSGFEEPIRRIWRR